MAALREGIAMMVASEGGVWLTLLAGVVAVAVAIARPIRNVTAAGLPSAPPVVVARRPAPVDSFSRVIARRNLFQPTRRPASVPYRLETPVPVVPPGPPKPVLRLNGIIGGPAPSAIIEGIPGSDGPVVVRSGEVIGPLTVGKIESSSVRIGGMDTTWVLRVTAPWQ
jgi:hypothetical protein